MHNRFFYCENLIYIYRWISNLILRSVNPGSCFKISAPDKYFIAIDFHIEALAARLMLIFVCPKVGDGSSIKHRCGRAWGRELLCR